MDFKTELNSISKTPKEIEQEKKNEYLNAIESEAKREVALIKEQIKDAAKGANYKNNGNKKTISIDAVIPIHTWNYFENGFHISMPGNPTNRYVIKENGIAVQKKVVEYCQKEGIDAIAGIMIMKYGWSGRKRVFYPNATSVTSGCTDFPDFAYRISITF